MRQQFFTLSNIANRFFQFSLITFLVLFLAETVKPGFVSYFFNLNVLLGIIFASGMLMMITIPKKNSSNESTQIKIRELRQVDKFDSLYVNSTPATEVDKRRITALQELQIYKETSEIPEEFTQVDHAEGYKEKILPYRMLIHETLIKLTQYMPTDAEYNFIVEAIEIQKSKTLLSLELILLEKKKRTTPRGKLEDLLTLYKQIFELRLKQLDTLSHNRS